MSPPVVVIVAIIHCCLTHSDVTSEDSTITLNIYDRAVPDLGFLGSVQIKPVLKHEHTVDQWYKYVAVPPYSGSCAGPGS